MADKTLSPNLVTFTLPRSKIEVSFDPDYSIQHVLAAQGAAGAAKKGAGAGGFQLYLIQRICTFNGKSLTVGELQEQVKGADFITLMGKVFAGEDEDEAGNG